MNCPKCRPVEQEGSRVIETRPHQEGRMLRRRRECLAHAKHRFTTYETVIEPDLPQAEMPQPSRKRMPRERQAITHKFAIGGYEGYITAGMYEDGTLGEIFLTDIGKEGSTLRGMMDAFATSISLSLQYGVPLEILVQKYSYVRFEPEGITANPEIPFAKSVPDYVMRWLASRFLDADAQEELGILTPAVRARKAAVEVEPSERPRSKAKARRAKPESGRTEKGRRT
jgi:ribonucleoside-diphosphate reductase alpha chain